MWKNSRKIGGNFRRQYDFYLEGIRAGWFGSDVVSSESVSLEPRRKNDSQ